MTARKRTKRASPLRRARLAAGLTQAQAARRCGWTQSRWSDLETGRYANPGIATLRRAAKALRCTVADLL